MRATTNSPSNPVELSVKRGGLLLLRALRLRCPHCGEGTLFASWLKMRESCTRCGFHYDRGEYDFYIGGYLINLIVAELIVVAAMLAFVAMTWPDVPWSLITWGLVALMVPAPFVTYPYSKALWLAVDLHFQPPKPSDFEPPPAS